MTTTTVRLTVYGDNHGDLLNEADQVLLMYMGFIPHDNEEDFINTDQEPEDHNLSYEMMVTVSSKDNQKLGFYTAEIIARFKK